MTTLFARTLMKGIADGMVDGGAMAPFANDDFATGIFDKVASDLGLPDILTEHLPTQTYIKVGHALLNAAKVAEANGLTADMATQRLAKQASSLDLADRALGTAAFYMDKAAEEASLNGTGSNTPESAAATNSIARLDQTNRSSLQYLVGMGNTDMPEGGVLGRQMVHPLAPRGPAINNSLTRLDKMAGDEDLQAADAELTPEEVTQLLAMQASANQKVGTALTFMDGLATRGAPITEKTVLASAILAESGTTGLEVMANLVGNTKTAEELDGHLDHVLAAGDAAGAAPDPHLVQAIEHALAQHGAEVPEGEEDEEDEEESQKAAGLLSDAKDLGKDLYRKGTRAGKEYLKSKGEGLKGYAKEKMESVRRSTGTETFGMKARDAAGKAKDKAKETASKMKEKAKEKAKEIGNSDAARKAKDYAPAAVAGAGLGALAGRASKSDDESEKKAAALMAFLKAAADGSLNEVEENTPQDAAHHNANAELDAKNRALTEYLEGAGKSTMPNVGHVGASMSAPKGPAKVHPDNTATRETKAASEYDYKVKAAAEFWGPKLPATLSPNEKRAHVIALAGMPGELQGEYLNSLFSR